MEMTEQEVADYLQTKSAAAIATLRRDGAPFVMPLAYVAEGNSLFFSVVEGRTILNRLRHDDRVSVTVFDEEAGRGAGVVLEGRGRVVPDDGNGMSRRIFRRRMSTVEELDLEQYEENWLAADRRLIEVVVERTVSWDGAKKADPVAEAGMSITEYRRSSGGAEG